MTKLYYERGPVRIYHGDCLEWLPSIEAGSIDAVVTDPPYGVGLVKKTSDYRDSQHFDRGESLKASTLYDDDPDEVRRLIPLWVDAIRRVSQRSVIFTGAANLWVYPEPSGFGSVFTPNGSGRCSWGFQCTHPLIFYGKDPYLSAGLGSRPTSFRTEQPNREHFDHPCPKPREWMTWAVERVSFPGQLICDPFTGSGTTAVACFHTDRRFIGCEREERYCEIIAKRCDREMDQGRLFDKSVPPPIQKTLIG